VNDLSPARSIGGYVPMVDGPDKVSGRAKYTADVLRPGMLAGRIYRSPHAHAEILEVDVAAAARLPGVKAIVTGADCDKTFGVLPIARSEHPLARERVRYKGEPVAAVAAVDDATARKAIELIRMKVRLLHRRRGARARRRRPPRPPTAQHRARRAVRIGQRRRGIRASRPGARGDL
jgi:4-hydroxybenzoyl-CoA reductase subunit alpha